MKTNLCILTCCICLFLTSCKDKSPVYATLENEELVWQGGGNHFYSAIHVIDPFYLLLDYENDTVIYVYKKDDLIKPFQIGLGKEKGGIWIQPEFTKSTSNRKDKQQPVLVIDNKAFIRELFFNDGDDTIQIVSRSLPVNIPLSSNYNFTSSDILGVPVMNNSDKLFYYYEKENSYWVAPPLFNQQKVNATDLYLNNLCVNEEKDAIVSALRFINEVLFYNLEKGELKTSFVIGDSLVLPEINSMNGVDISQSINYIIDIYGTPEYVYCLYDGTCNYTGLSDIYVFTWAGKHIATLKTRRNLKRIAVDRQNSYMLAIADNGNGGREIIKYTLSKK